MTGAEIAFVMGVLCVCLAGCSVVEDREGERHSHKVTMDAEDCAITWEAGRSSDQGKETTSVEGPGL